MDSPLSTYGLARSSFTEGAGAFSNGFRPKNRKPHKKDLPKGETVQS